ncbi:MAG TPA: hypothetical protein VNN72_01550 [Polyangiaceae bacterium]|nr:hypothetical protein [Polyangiaceae bacterium]
MERLGLRQWLIAGSSAAGVVLWAGLLWLAILELGWLPSTRTVVVDARCSSECRLEWTPDIGRGFLYLDSKLEMLPAGATSVKLALPLTASRVRLVFSGFPGSAGVQDVRELKRAGSSVLTQNPHDPSVFVLPLLRSDVPSFAYAASAVLVLVLLGALGLRRVRRRLVEFRDSLRGEQFATPRSFVLALALFALAVLVMATAADAYHVLIGRIDDPPYWPISMFDPEPFRPGVTLGAALALVTAFFGLRVVRDAAPRGPLGALAFGLPALVLTNWFQGFQAGFVRPMAGDQSYFAESFAVDGVGSYLAHYNEWQAQLGTHARTHPPGAVLLHYFARKLVANPGALALLLGAAVFTLAVVSFSHLARRFAAPRAAATATLVFALLPAVQIYFITSLEAVAAALMLAAVSCFFDTRKVVRLGGTAGFLLAAALLTFSALFVPLVLCGFALLSRQSLRAALGTVLSVAALLVLLRAATGFDWLSSLRTASALENPEGFWLLAAPGSYLFTRLESLSEVCLFASPLVLVAALWLLGSRALGHAELRALVGVALGAFALMLLAGAFKTGETARSCLFVAPFLVLPLAAVDEACELTPSRRTFLTGAVFAQSVVMQLAGQYYW